jgi:hypothetical protein
MTIGYRRNRLHIAGFWLIMTPMITIPKTFCVEVGRSVSRLDRPHFRQIEKTKFKNKAWK